jgi:hypothetical protein
LEANMLPNDASLLEFERAATVALVATDHIVRCGPTDRAWDVLSQREHLEFDHFPVVAGGSTLGVLSRPERWEDGVRGDLSVHAVMEPIRPEMLVARCDPLIAVIERMSDGPPFRLVLEVGEVKGILTLSDLGRLPSRAVMFARITHLEMLLASYIRARCAGRDNLWLSHLSPGRRTKIENTYNDLRNRRQNLDLVSAGQFCDKRIACCKLGLVIRDSPHNVAATLERIERLRDLIAHAMSSFHEGESARDTAGTVRELGTYIADLTRQLSDLDPVRA